MLELLLETGEDYQREVEIDRELYQVIALTRRESHKAGLLRATPANVLAKATRTAANSRGASRSNEGDAEQADANQHDLGVERTQLRSEQ